MKKTPGDIIILQKCTKNHIICYTVPEIRCVTDVILTFTLGYFLPFYRLNDPKNQNLKKMTKSLEISSFYTCVPKIMITWCTVPEIWCTTNGQTDGRMDGKKRHIERWVPHLTKRNIKIKKCLWTWPWGTKCCIFPDFLP